jgi:GT2 family glycosyltransferase
VEALRAESVAAAAPGVYSLTEPTRRGFGLALTGPDLHARWLHRQGGTPYPVPILPGCFLAMRRSTFCDTGGYDSAMAQLGNNDNELSCRLWLLGYQMVVVPAFEVGHLFRVTTPYDAQWVSVVHNRLRMALVHFDSQRVERVVDALRGYQAFPAAMAMMLNTDVFTRRAALAQLRRFSDGWYCERFSLPC